MLFSKLSQQQEQQFKLIFDSVKKNLGFVPNSIKYLAHKPFILGSLGTLHTSIMGFSSPSSPTKITGLKLFFKNFIWALKARKQSDNEVPRALKNLVAYMASSAAGCRYCQAHTAYEAFHQGVSIEKIQALWQFENSEYFDVAEVAALRFALAAGSHPNAVEVTHHEALKKYYTVAQVTEIIATVALFGFLNRWNDSVATPLENEPADFAQRYLSQSGWNIGKHAG